jgi:hypothetical protein
VLTKLVTLAEARTDELMPWAWQADRVRNKLAA